MPRKRTQASADRLPIPAGPITRRIFLVLGHNVMLSPDLAELYQVEVKVLNQAVKGLLTNNNSQLIGSLS